MAFTRDKFGLHFSLPLSAEDWSNLLNSHVRHVQMPLPFCSVNTCQRLAQHGISLSVRVPNDRTHDVGSVVVELHAIRRNVQLDGVVWGNEPEHDYDMQFGSPDWGNRGPDSPAAQHRDLVHKACDILHPLGIPVVSPGWKSRVKDYNWHEGLFPGEQSWLEITRVAYNRCAFNGFHWYGYDGTNYDVRERMRRTLHREQERRHKKLWVNEVAVDRGTQVERMAVYIQIARNLLSEGDPVWRGSGERVELFVPFVSNGTPNGHWPEGMLIRDPEAYRLLGEFMQEGR